MDRVELVKKLELLKPALAENTLVPILQCYQFSGSHVIANNDELAIMTPCVTAPFAVNGRNLLGLLQNSASGDVDLKINDDDNQLTVQAGRSTFKLPYFMEEEFLFEEPSTWAAKFPMKPRLINGLRYCLTTVSSDLAKPALMGIRAVLPGCLYSCDGDSLTEISGELNDGTECAFVIPSSFCQALLRIMDETESYDGYLEFNNEWIKAHLAAVDYTIYGRLMVIDNPIDYEKLIYDSLTEEPTYFAVPKALDAALSRARVLTDQESASTELSIEAARLKLRTETHMGIVRDSLVIDEVPYITVNVSAELVQRLAAQCDEMAVLPTCTTFRKPSEGLFQLVSNIGS